MFGKKAKRIAYLEEKVRELERLSPTGIAGIGGLAIAEYFEQWEQTGYDPYTQIPIVDIGVIEKSAVTQAINKVAIEVLKDKRAAEIISYVFKLSPEIVEQQLHRLPLDVLAHAIVKSLDPVVINAWVQSNGNTKELLELLMSLQEQKDPLSLLEEQIRADGTAELLSLPEGTVLALYFDNERSYYGNSYDPWRESKSIIKDKTDRFNTFVQIIITRNENTEKYLRMNHASLATDKELKLQLPITFITASFNPNEMVFGHKYSCEQWAESNIIKKTNLGKLVKITICPSQE